MASVNSALEDSLLSAAPLPMTPERGRARTRYPSHLSRLDAEGNPRPLLHRRGTSRTYETLEDLLKEAGYKETRIFTPELERREAEREEQKEHEVKQQTSVGGAVVKLFSTWMSSRKAGAEHEGKENTFGSSSSPLAHRSKHIHSNVSTVQLSSPPRTSNSSTLTIRPLKHRESSLSLLQRQHSLTNQLPSRPTMTASSTSSLHPPSRARIALRHAASAPHMDKRRVRTQPRASRSGKARVPPLPVTWLESISAALRSPRVHSSTPSPVSPSNPGGIPRKPSILIQRGHISVGAVTITNVVCRSAPSSRSSSAVRPSRVPVPTLAQTSVCEELVDATWPPHLPHHLPAPAPAPIDDDEDEELDLTMMLIPAKRQHSIRSLRSVLLQHNSFPFASAMPGAREQYARMMRRRIEESEAEHADGSGEGHWDSGEFLSARVKRRRSGLPGNWGWAS